MVERNNGTVRAIIEDDGCGFAVDEHTGVPHGANGSGNGSGSGLGLGLQGIRERAELVGGNVTIESNLGAGTTLFVTIPIEQSAAARPS